MTLNSFEADLRFRGHKYVTFDVNDSIVAVSASTNPDKLVLHLFDTATQKKVGSYAIDQIDHADFLPEYRDQNMSTDFCTFDQAVKMAMERK